MSEPSGQGSFQPRFTITHAITAHLTRIERARGFLEAAELSAGWLKEMEQRALVLEAHHTTHIEGTRLTLAQAEVILDGKVVQEADPDDVRELLNYRAAFEFVSGYLKSQAPITEGLIREIHKHLVEGVRGGAAAQGEYRKIQNYLVNSATGETVYTPPPAFEVPILMAQLVEWLNRSQEIHPILVSGIAQFQLVHIHPFLDGNGRTSRLLSMLILYRSGYDFKRLFTLSEYYDRERRRFYRALQSVRENDMDMTIWLEYFTEGLATQLAEVRARGEKVIFADLIAKKYRLNPRQSKAVFYILEHGKINIQDCERLFSQVAKRTLQRDLQALVQKNVLSENASSPTDPGKWYSISGEIMGKL